ncbi:MULTISPECIES: porin family protein [Flavobacterium]|uniref:Outer membrane protein beta-barrel domain-containing protein n=1 Tax=Flavobacterium commune TaxID=1306519 RepID=A0A1D9P6N0_9FLAO|nr:MULTISPECIES: porin family protein [Flavobacterium]AOZ98237.1 hypothetical protein BIW12_01605 [Flavobacterium commune]
MKKIILSAMAVLAFTITNAQEVKFGVKVGGNVSSLNVNGGEIGDIGVLRFNSIVGVQAGGFAEIKVASNFAIQPEVLFSTEGSEFGFEGTDAKINLSYVNVPVMAKYFASEKISLQVGPQIGFLVGAKGKMGDDSTDIKDSFKSINFGVNFGLGYDINEKVLIDFRYNLGLSNIAEEEFMGGDSKMKSSAFSLALGYKF